MIVVGVDPGLAATAVVAYDTLARRIIDAATYKTPADGPRPDFAAAVSRARVQGDSVARFAADHNAGLIIAEGYEDFGGGHKRGVSNRWTTPLVCMAIACATCRPVTWQAASVVMRRYAPHKAAWASRQYGIIAGDERLTNDHTRSAACHVLAWIDGGAE